MTIVVGLSLLSFIGETSDLIFLEIIGHKSGCMNVFFDVLHLDLSQFQSIFFKLHIWPHSLHNFNLFLGDTQH